MARLLWLTIVLIAYGSLYPWYFHAYQYPTGPLWILFHNWPLYWNRHTAIDIAVNVLVYLPLGFFAFGTFAAKWRASAAAFVALLIGVALSFSAELAQCFVVGRVTSALDVLTNSAGTLGGMVAASIWWRHHRVRAPAIRNDALLLIACWFLYQMFPFIPNRGGPKLILGWPAVDSFLYFATATALWPAVNALGGSAQTRRFIYTGLLVIVPLRAFLFTGNVSVAELASTAAALAIVLLLPVGRRVAAVILGIVLLVHGLAPFTFQAQAQAFSWIPFQASIVSSWEPGFDVLLGKVYAYGALVWLIRESGVRLRTAAMVTMGLLAAVEVVQLHLPGRSPEITDPVIALILAWVLWSLESHRSLARHGQAVAARNEAP